VQNLLNSDPVKHFASSDVIDLGTPKRVNNSSILVIMVLAVHEFVSNASSHFEVASMTIRKFLFLYGPKKSTCKRVHGCSGYFHGESTALGGVGLIWIQFSHLCAMSSMSLSSFGHQKYERAMAFMLLIPECTECNSRNNAALNLSGIIILYPHIRQSCSVVLSCLREKYGFRCASLCASVGQLSVLMALITRDKVLSTRVCVFILF